MKNSVRSLQSNTSTPIWCDNSTDDIDTMWKYINESTDEVTTIYPWIYRDWYWHTYPDYTYVSLNKTEQAFKIVKLLKDKKLAKVTTVKQFVELVEEISKVL